MIQRRLAFAYEHTEQVVRPVLLEADAVEWQQTRMRILVACQRNDVEVLDGARRVGDHTEAIAIVHIVKVGLVADLLTVVGRYELEYGDLAAGLLELLQIVVDLLRRNSTADLNAVMNVLWG